MRHFPYDVQLTVLKLLSVRDVVQLCATCKTLHELMADRSIWHNAMMRILFRFPQPHLFRRLSVMSADELRAEVLRSARLDRLWHGVDYHPRLITDFHCNGAVEHVNMVAGGTWLVLVLYDGSLQLHELGAPHPAVTLAPSLTKDESVFYLSSRRLLANEREDLIILQMGVRYNQCNIYVYRVTVAEPSPAIVLVGKVSVTGSVWCCASGGELLVYGLESGGGDMVLHVCRIGAQHAAAPSPQPGVSLNIGPWSADEDFTISVLSERLLMLAHQGGLSIYAIPALPSARRTQTQVVAVQPLWTRQCDIGAGIYRISPFAWGGRAPPPHPLVISGTRALHLVRVRLRPGALDDAAEEQFEYSEVPYPFALGAEIDGGRMGLGAVGLRRAIWDCTEARNGSAHVRFRTYSLPRAVLGAGYSGGGDGDVSGDTDAEELGLRGKLGSFSVALDPAEHLVSLCLEESSGRVCLLLNNVATGARRISIIDPV